jgi:hypothetical protein
MLKLPKSAQSIFTRIVAEDAAIFDAAHRRITAMQELSAQEVEALAEYHNLKEADESGKLNREERENDDAGNQIVTKVRDTERLQEASARIDLIREQKAAIAPAHSTPRLTSKRIAQELAKYHGRKLIAVDRPTVVLGKSERMVDALARLRGETLNLIAERKAVDKAPRTADEVKAAMSREIDKLAARVPRTLPMYHGAGIEWPQHEIHAGKYRAPDGIALVAFLFGDTLKRELSKHIDFNAGAFPDAMSRVERAKRLAELETEIATAEALEAAAVEAVTAEGGTAHHRPDVDVLAVLSLRVK